MDIIITKLIEIRRNPGMYLGRISLERLYMYINGYLSRQYEIDANYEDKFNEFDGFVQRYYHTSDRRSWDYVITENTKSDEEPIDNFYLLLDKFIKNNT